MTKITPEMEQRIFELWFSGEPRDNIARKLRISGYTVSERVNRLPECLTPLRDLSVELRKLDLLPVDALQGVEALRQLAEIGVKPEQIPSFVQAVQKISTEAGYQPEQVIQAAIKLSEIETQSGKTYLEATKDFETLTQENAGLKQENTRLQREILENKKKRKQTLKQANMTETEISRVNLLNARLRSHGVDLYDTENLLKFLVNLKEMKFNPRRFVSLSKKHDSLTRSLSRISAEIQEKSLTLVALRREIQTERTTISELQSTIRYCQEAATKANYIKSQLEAEVNSKSTVLWNLNADIAEKERVRQALVIQNARLSGVPESEIQEYQLQKRLELLEEISKIRIRQLLEEGHL